MRRGSLLGTVVVRVALTVVAAHALASVWSYVGWWRMLHDELDRSLRAAAATQVAALRHAGPSTVDALHPTVSAMPGDATGGGASLMVLRSRAGEVLYAKPESAARPPVDSSAFHLALHGEAAVRSEAWGRHPMRTLYVPLGADGPAAVLQVAASMEPIHVAMHRMVWLLALAGGIATLTAVVGACVLTRGALTSIREIATQAHQVRAGTAGQRITVEAPVREGAELVEVLNGLLERLDRASEWQRRLISDLGHDIRTPITVLRASAESALLTDRSPERYRAVLRSTLEEIDRLALISDSLILLARFQSGALAPHYGRVDLDRLVREIAGRVRSAGTEIALQLEASEATLVADRRMLGLAIEELARNAVVHNDPATPVTIGVSRDAASLTVTVEDRGRGVESEVLGRLFDLGFRTDQARGRAGGAGLGLTVVAAVTAAHGGRVQASSPPAGGLSVSLTLPIAAPAALARA